MAEHVLVTGGAGFIGTALVKHLNEHGYITSTFDHHPQRAATGKIIVRDLLTPSCFEIELDKLHQEKRVDRVIHLAAQVGRLFGEDDLRHAVRSNAEMTTVIAKHCGELKIPMVYTSTSEVYGDQGHKTCHEDGRMELPHNLYGLSKRWGEETCKLYNPWNLVIWRPSMPYGPGAPPGRGRRALDNMLWQAHHRLPIIVHRNAERSWCWIGDIVEAMRLTIEERQLDGFSSDVGTHMPKAYNIGRDDDPRSMMDIAIMACDIAGAPLSLIQEIDPPGKQTVVKKLSTEKIRQLGWEPTVDLHEGMIWVYKWVKQFDIEGRMAA